MLPHCERNGGASGRMVGRAVPASRPSHWYNALRTTRCQRVAAYGLAPDTPEPEIVAHLFKLYAEKTAKHE